MLRAYQLRHGIKPIDSFSRSLAGDTETFLTTSIYRLKAGRWDLHIWGVFRLSLVEPRRVVPHGWLRYDLNIRVFGVSISTLKLFFVAIFAHPIIVLIIFLVPVWGAFIRLDDNCLWGAVDECLLSIRRDDTQSTKVLGWWLLILTSFHVVWCPAFDKVLEVLRLETGSFFTRELPYITFLINLCDNWWLRGSYLLLILQMLLLLFLMLVLLLSWLHLKRACREITIHAANTARDAFKVVLLACQIASIAEQLVWLG